MADEITYLSRLAVAKGPLAIQVPSTTQRITMTGDAVSDQVQDIGTTHEAIDVASAVGTEGVAYFANLDSTNSVSIGVEVAATFYPMIMLKPTETFVVRLDPTTTLYAEASATGGAALRTLVVED